MREAAYLFFPAIFVAIVILAFRRTRRIVKERFQEVARRSEGRVVEGWWILFPRLVFDLDGTEMQVMAMPGGENRTQQTFSWVGCDDYPKTPVALDRRGKRVGLLERGGWQRANTGERDFDEVFWQQAEDEEVVQALFDDELRAMLMDFDEKLHVRLSLLETVAFQDGRRNPDRSQWRLELSIRKLPAEIEDIQRLVEATGLAHVRLLQLPTARRSA